MPGLAGRRRYDTSSDDYTSDESYVYSDQQQRYHTDNDNSSIDDS